MANLILVVEDGKKFSLELEWDETKNVSNIEKHGLDFIDAEKVLREPHITFEDARQNYGEKRFLTIGRLQKRFVVMVYTWRKQKLRIISLRKANEREKKTFKNGLEARRRDDG